VHQNDTHLLVTAHQDVETNARESHALLAEARGEVGRQSAAEAVRRLNIRRHGVAVVVQRLVGDDVTDVEFFNLVDELTVA
jgi:hypothetical protein